MGRKGTGESPRNLPVVLPELPELPGRDFAWLMDELEKSD